MLHFRDRKKWPKITVEKKQNNNNNNEKYPLPVIIDND